MGQLFVWDAELMLSGRSFGKCRGARIRFATVLLFRYVSL
jgi:hypothetical protein